MCRDRGCRPQRRALIVSARSVGRPREILTNFDPLLNLLASRSVDSGTMRPMIVRWLLTLVALLALASCSSSRAEGPPARRAFYYWRTTFQLSAAEQRALVELGVSRLYVRVFDVEWNQTESAPSMIGKITAASPSDQVPAGTEVVPVVFLRQEVFRHLDPKRLGELARSTWSEVTRRAKLLGFVPRELQLDCDWTDTTQAAFFEYLRQLRGVSGVALGSTIRLHQVKYRERTGVPPVERGMLMFYNMGRFSADADERAIFDPASAEQYLSRISEYPLPLDVALPIWSWAVHVRDERVVGLLQSTDPDELPAVEFLEPAGADRFVATRTAFLHGALLREGDVLKIERMGPAETLAAAAMLAPHLSRSTPATRTLSLFDLSERNLKRYGQDQLDLVFRAVR